MDTASHSTSGLAAQHQPWNLKKEIATFSLDLPCIDEIMSELGFNSGFELEEGPPQDASTVGLAMTQSAQEIDTLDVSKLEYPFNTLKRSKSNHKTIKEQFIPVRSFIRLLDRHNRAYAFTVPQYLRAWEYAVRLHENEVAINELIKSNPNLDADGIDRLFVQQIQRVIHSVKVSSIKTKFERAVNLHEIVSRSLRSALDRGNRQPKHQKHVNKLQKRLAVLERDHGIAPFAASPQAPNPASCPPRKRSSKRNRDPYAGYSDGISKPSDGRDLLG